MDAKLREFERQCFQGDHQACYGAFKAHLRMGTPLGEIDPHILDIGTKQEMLVQEPLDFRDLLHRIPSRQEGYYPRNFNSIRFNHDIRISIQASQSHYCSPREDLDKFSYDSWEIMFYNPHRRRTIWDAEEDQIRAYR